MIELVDITRDDDPLLERFHAGIYLDAFATQHEPLAAWQRALRGDAPYSLHLRIARDGDAIVGGIAYEAYPQSTCGLVTYMAVAPDARRVGLGKRLLGDAIERLHGAGMRAVFGEVNDPRIARPQGDETPEQAWRRLERNQRWGARIVDARYVQPALAAELARDRGLLLIVLDAAAGDTMPGAIVRAFVAELFEATEGHAPDPELRAILDGIPEHVPLVQLAR